MTVPLGPQRNAPEPVLDADDSPKEACGVFAVYAPNRPVSHLTHLGLYALQHRGQEAAGMAVSDGRSLRVLKEEGLVLNVFNERNLAPLTGHLAIGHTRYSTTGSSTWRNAQPVFREVGHLHFALGHNGNLVNTAQLVEEAGMLPGTVSSDSDAVAELLAQEIAHGEDHPGLSADGRELERALLRVLPRLEGAFSFVLADEGRIIGIRDPHGLRPLCLGRLDHGWVLASESPALDIVGAKFDRELDPGEMLVIDATGERSLHPWPKEAIEPRLCIFEFVYFARPDTQLYGRSVHQARIHMGELLAEQAPVEADMVMGVPESSTPAAEGYARASGIPYGQGLVKNRYIGRTFIAPSPELRELAVRMKYNPLTENISGKRLVVVDDSIVRGTTQRQVVKMLREAGAREVHLRITSPPVKWSCFYGIDTGDRDELLANTLQDVEQIREFFGADSLAYLTLDRLVTSTGVHLHDGLHGSGDGLDDGDGRHPPSARGFCDACFTGDYPVEVPVPLNKHVLEADADPDRAALDGGAPARAGDSGQSPTPISER